MDLGLTSIIVALILGVSSIVSSFFWGYVPKKRKSQIKKLRQELLDVYMDVYYLKIVEERLEEENGVSKQSARDGLNISSRIESKRIEKRIAQLQSKLQNSHD